MSETIQRLETDVAAIKATLATLAPMIVRIDERLAHMATKAEVTDQFSKVTFDLSGIKSDVRVLKWQVGALMAIAVVIGLPSLWLLVRTAAKVGTLFG